MGEMGILFSMMPENKVGDMARGGLLLGQGSLQEWGQMEWGQSHNSSPS